MKIDRLIGIITTLQRKKTVTAAYLAEKFEVSRRTIMRDVEDICKAGIPLVTAQGAGGGISIMEGFSLDTTVFTEEELAAIFTGLKSLDSVSYAPSAEKLAEKLGGPEITSADNMLIDLSSFYKGELAPKIDFIKRAIRESRLIGFRYCCAKGEEDKLIEPYLIVFKWSDWYVFGFSRERADFRLYKLRRLWGLYVTDETFMPRYVPEEKKKLGSNMTDDYVITAVYDPSVKYRLVEEYGHSSFTELEDGGLYTEWGFSTASKAMGWLLSFGDKVRVIDPPEMVELMKNTLKKMQGLYEI